MDINKLLRQLEVNEAANNSELEDACKIFATQLHNMLLSFKAAGFTHKEAYNIVANFAINILANGVKGDE